MKTDRPLDAVLKRLNLANTRRIWRDLCARAEKQEWLYEDFLSTLVAEEVAHRQQTRLQKLSEVPLDDLHHQQASRRLGSRPPR